MTGLVIDRLPNVHNDKLTTDPNM